ncbi:MULTISPECIES: helix-turn-helix domain-containing protein [unclassified Glutamicibacter]|uniref:helix-turn-helix domain-containing protein n=1 Tax=unclassified Glutamicibacter TaxID=2627139 RepID=UPI0037FEC8EC
MATPSTLERLYPLRELQDANYGDRTTLMKRIHDGTLPAVKVGNAYRIRESDLPLIAKPIGDASSTAPKPAADLDDLAALASQIVSNWPRLSAERRAELGRLLAAA